MVLNALSPLPLGRAVFLLVLVCYRVTKQGRGVTYRTTTRSLGSSNALLNEGDRTMFCFPLLPFVVCLRKQGDTQTTQETPDSVVPGIGSSRVARHVLRNVRQLLDQCALGLDVRYVGVIEVVTPRDRIAALRVGMGE